MPKPKKDKIVTFVDGEIRIETTVHVPGVRPRTLRGRPWVATIPTDVRMGCLRFTNEAIHEIVRCMVKQARSRSSDAITHQTGNYGEPE